MKLWQSVLCSLITWPLNMLIGITLYLLGWIIVPLALIFKIYSEQFTIYGYYRLCWNNPLMRPWQNYEDGIAGPASYLEDKPLWVRILAWSCKRNPVSGLRWTPLLSVIPATSVKYVGTYGNIPGGGLSYEVKMPNWYYAWLGPYSCFWWQFNVNGTLYRFWLGTAKLYPFDAVPQDYGYRKYGTTVFAQLKRVQAGDNKN